MARVTEPGQPHTTQRAPAVAVRGLGKTFIQKRRQIEALRGIDLELDPGEFLVILGASGCGKTTLLNAVAGFDAPTAGSIEVFGQPVTRPGPDRVMVFQQYALFPWMTVLENVAFGLRLAGVPKKEREERARRQIRLVHLDGFEDSYPKELSGGMKQRIAIARSLTTNPEILLMDEPFAAVDAMTRSMLQTELAELHATSGKTVLFITHSIDEALLLSTKLLVLSSRPGQVLELVDNPLPRPRNQELMASPQFQELRQRIWRLVESEVTKSLAH